MAKQKTQLKLELQIWVSYIFDYFKKNQSKYSIMSFQADTQKRLDLKKPAFQTFH